MPEYPEHEKLHETMELSDFTNRLGAALDYGRYILAEWVPASCGKCDGTGRAYDPFKDKYYECPKCEATGNDPERKELVMARGGLNHNLAELFGIDYDKLMDEKDQMLAEIRAAQPEVLPR